MNFLQLIRRFVPPYKGLMALNILFNLLSTVLSLFSFAAIIPVLQLLFGLSEAGAAYTDLATVSGLNATLDALKGNLYFYMEQLALTHGGGSVLAMLGVFLVVMTGLKCFTAWMANYFMVPIRTGVLRDLRQMLYDKIVSLPIGYFTEERKGDVMSRMTNDVNEVEASIMAALDVLFKDPIMLTIYIVTLFCISWELTLFVLLLLPLAGLLIGRVGRSLKRSSQHGQEQNAEILTQIEETLGGLRVVKAFNAEDKLRARFADLINDTRRTFNRINRRYYLAHPVSEFLGTALGRSLKRSSQHGQEQNAEILTQIEETLGGLRVVKAFNAEDKLRARFANLINDSRRTFNRINRRYYLAHPVSEFLGTALIAIILWFGGVLILSDHSSIDAATFIYYLVIFYSIINPAKDLSKAGYGVRKGMASLERIDKILNTPSNIQEPQHPKALQTFRDRIVYKDVCFAYRQDVPVLQDINLTIQKGQMVALVGQSGSGKTTLADLLPRFYDPATGCITIDGTDIREVRSYDLRALMGNVNQEAILFNDTFFNNITFGVDLSQPAPDGKTWQAAVEAAARIANAHEFIMATPEGYETNIGDRGSRLSGGQRQRISIARAILKNPPILILDEATSALDTESEKQVQEALEWLMKERTTLVVAHRLSTIRNADLICVMHEGRIVETGKHEELIKRDGYYRRLVEMQGSK